MVLFCAVFAALQACPSSGGVQLSSAERCIAMCQLRGALLRMEQSSLYICYSLLNYCIELLYFNFAHFWNIKESSNCLLPGLQICPGNVRGALDVLRAHGKTGGECRWWQSAHEFHGRQLSRGVGHGRFFHSGWIEVMTHWNLSHSSPPVPST